MVEKLLQKKKNNSVKINESLAGLAWLYLENFQEVTDQSDGCGAKFSALIVSSKFEGKPLLQRHRMVNSVLEEELKVIHAFSQQTLTPQQWEEKKRIMNAQDTFRLKLSAPGKVILFGEYSVVFNKPAVAATLNLNTKLYFKETKSEFVHLNFKALGLNKKFELKDIRDYLKLESLDWDNYLQSLKNFFNSLYNKSFGDSDLTDAQKNSLIAFFHCFGKIFYYCSGFDIEIDSELPVGSGVGSSASFSVVLSAAVLIYDLYLKKNENILELIKRNCDGQLEISEKFRSHISDMAFSCEKIFHGTPSGVDHNTIIQGSMIEFIKSLDNKNKMSQISASPIKIMLVNTNVSRSTKKLLVSVKQLKENHPEIVTYVLNAMENIAKNAISDLKNFKENKDDIKLEQHFGELVRLNHDLLRVLGVSHSKLEEIVSIANKYELNAKLTGGGGGGFAFIYLPNNVETPVIKAIEKDLSFANFTFYEVTLGGPGLTVQELLL